MLVNNAANDVTVRCQDKKEAKEKVSRLKTRKQRESEQEQGEGRNRDFVNIRRSNQKSVKLEN